MYSYNLRNSVDFLFFKCSNARLNSSFIIFLFSFSELIIFSIRIFFPLLTGYLSTTSFIFLGEVSWSNRITRSNVLNNSFHTFAIRETQNFEYCCLWDASWRSDMNFRTEKQLKHNYISSLVCRLLLLLKYLSFSISLVFIVFWWGLPL